MNPQTVGITKIVRTSYRKVSPLAPLVAFVLGFSAATDSARAQFTFASDDASNYGATWTDGEDGGTGFGGWGFQTNANTGSFLGNPTNNGIANTNMGATAFGMFSTTNNSLYANRSRGFDVGMGIGDTFSFNWGINWDAGSGAKGFDIRAGGTTLFTLINGGSSTITFTNLLNGTSSSASGSAGTNNMAVTLTRTTTGYTFTMPSRNTGTLFTTNISTSATIDNFNFFIGNQSDSDGRRNMYFDNLSITNSGVFSQGGSVTNANTFAGTGALSVGNNTTLALSGSGNNNYTGATTISNGSTLRFQGSGTSDFASAISGGGNIVVSNGSGQVNLQADNSTFTGNITVANGSLEAQSVNALGSGAGSAVVESGGTLRLWNSTGITYGTEDLTLNGAGVGSGGALRNITNNNTWQSTITLGSGSRINSDAGTLTIDVASGNAITGSQNLTVGGAGNVTINDNVNIGGSNLIKDGSGILTLGAVNNYTGETQINQGTLTLGASGGVSSSSTIFIGNGGGGFGSANATLALSNTGSAVASPIVVNVSAGSGTRTLSAANTSGTATVTGGITMNRDLTLSANAGGNLLITTGAVAMGTNDVIVTGANNVAIDSAITASSGSASLTMNGAGTLTISGNNSSGNLMQLVLENGTTRVSSLNNLGQPVGSFYRDKINFNGGTLSVTEDMTIAVDTFGMTTAANGGTINVAPGKTFTQNAAFSSGNAAGAFNKTGSGTLVLGVTTNQMNPTFNVREGTVAVAGTGALGGGSSVTLGDTGTAGTLRYTGGGFSTGRTFTVNSGGGTIDVSNAATSVTNSTGMVFNGTFTKAGNGVLVLGASGSGTGKISIDAGTLSIDAAANLGNATGSDALTLNGGILRTTTGMTLGTRGVTLGANGGTISTMGGTTLTNSAGISGGTGGLTKDGSGTLVLSGANTYSGATTIANGAVVLGSSGVLSSNTAVNLTGSASRFDVSGISATGLTNGSLAGVAGSTVNLGAKNLNIGRDNTSTSYEGTIDGASGGSLTKSGNGTLTLSGNNTYSGGTTVTGGMLAIGAANNLGTASGASALTLNGGVLRTTNSMDLGARGISLGASGGGISTRADTTLTNSAGISGANAALTKLGSGTLALTAANSYTGATIIDNGEVALRSAGALSADTAVNLTGSGARFDISAMSVGGSTNGSLAGVAGSVVNLGAKNLNVGRDNSSTTYAGIIEGVTGSLTKSGTGIFTLAGNNTYTGATVVSQGTLRINGDQSLATGDVTVASTATLGGSGTVGGATTISGIHSPGNSAGVQTFVGNLTYSPSSSLTWELFGNTASGRGSLFDGVNVGGDLSFGSPFTLNLVFNAQTSTVDWSDSFWASDRTGSDGWLLYQVTGTTAGTITLTSNFEDINSSSLTSVRAGASFGTTQIGDDIYVTYLVPEPSTYALLGIAAVGVAAHIVRRRRRS